MEYKKNETEMKSELVYKFYCPGARFSFPCSIKENPINYLVKGLIKETRIHIYV